MDIRLVEDFLDLCKTGNFSETAENRFVTQPTLSRRIKQLEDWLGATLILRQIRPVQLTEEGSAFFPIAQEMHHWVATAQGRFDNELAAASGGNSAVYAVAGQAGPNAAREPGDERLADEGVFRILLIDDSEVSLMVLARLVESEGHRCGRYTSGEEALETFESGDWDLALCDYQMPGIDGALFADRIREIETRRMARPMPIVGVSTNTDLDSISTCFKAGMNDYLSKPVGLTELKVVLDRWLPQSQTLEAAELDALNDRTASGLGDRTMVSSFCESMRPKVRDIADAIELGSADIPQDLLPSIRDEAYMIGAYSFARTCVQLAKSAQSGSMRELLEKRGPFLSEFIRLETSILHTGHSE